jgi:hypothetical protein
VSKASRKLQVGARVITDFSGKFTKHEIIERVECWTVGQSGVGFRVRPLVPRSTGGLIDADWFEPVATKET